MILFSRHKNLISQEHDKNLLSKEHLFVAPKLLRAATEGILTLHRYLHTQSNCLLGMLTLNQHPHQLQAVKVETFVNKKSATCSQRRIGRCPHAKIVKCAHQVKIHRPSPFQKTESQKALQQRSMVHSTYSDRFDYQQISTSPLQTRSFSRSRSQLPAISSVAQSLSPSVTRSLDRSIARSRGRSVARSSISRSLDRSIARSLERLIARSLAK